MSRADHRAMNALILGKAGAEGFEVEPYPGYTRIMVTRRVNYLKDQGLLFAGSRGHRTKRYFRTEEAANRWTAGGAATVMAATFRLRQRSVRLDRDLPTIVPPTVKVQVCPGFAGDHRFTPTGAFDRVITADWMLARQQATTERRAP